MLSLSRGLGGAVYGGGDPRISRSLAGGGISIPSERLATFTLQALADAFSNAAVLTVYEGRHRP
jgi:hypothetical protein